MDAQDTTVSAVKKVIGRPWPKGVSGNPGGMPKDSVRREIMLMLRELRKPAGKGKGKTERRLIVEALVAEARAGNVQAFEAIANRVDGKPVSQDDVERGDRSRAPSVTVNLFQVLGTLPEEALAKLEQAAVEAEAVRVLPQGDE